MKTLKSLVTALAVSSLFTLSSTALAADTTPPAKTSEKVKPYPLKTCVVTDEKLGDMGEPYVIKHQGREIKFCCKGCVKDFNKEPAKYLKKLDAAEKKPGKQTPAAAKPPAHSHGHAGHKH
jgi:YHS domain-containing protein